MGANNSIPRTAEFFNPSVEHEVLTVTQQVSNRIEDLRKQEMITNEGKQNLKSYTCNNCGREKEVQTSILAKTSEEVERNSYETQLRRNEKEAFEKAYETVETTLRKPINVAQERSIKLKALESDLLKCYTEYHGEPLRCDSNAKDYQKFVFDNQYELILNHLKASGDKI